MNESIGHPIKCSILHILRLENLSIVESRFHRLIFACPRLRILDLFDVQLLQVNNDPASDTIPLPAQATIPLRELRLRNVLANFQCWFVTASSWMCLELHVLELRDTDVIVSTFLTYALESASRSLQHLTLSNLGGLFGGDQLCTFLKRANKLRDDDMTFLYSFMSRREA